MSDTNRKAKAAARTGDAAGGLGTAPAHYPAAIEALLFAADAPLTFEVLQGALSNVDESVVPLEWVEDAVHALRERYSTEDRGFQLVAIAQGWELRTRAAYSDYVRQLYAKPPVRLSRAALEVLSVVAYRQPCTRADVEDIRGVDCSRLLRSLLDRSLIRIIGKADDVGRPLLYGTSQAFLEFFGLTALSELPTLKEYTELTEDHVVKLQELEETLRATEDAALPPSPDEPPAPTSAEDSDPDGAQRG